MIETVLDWLFGRECPMCGRPGSWCRPCRDSVQAARFRLTEIPGPRVEGLVGLPVASAGQYLGGWCRVVRALKEGGRVDPQVLDRLVTGSAGLGPRPQALVPVRSSSGATRRRGFEPARRLALALSPRLGVPVVDGLEMQAQSLQKERGAGQRRSGPDRFGAGRRLGRVWLVDDVVTTGATLAQAAQRLHTAGSEVTGALVLAHASLPEGLLDRALWAG